MMNFVFKMMNYCRDAHLRAIQEQAQARAEKRSRTLMLELKSQLSSSFTMSGVGLEQQVRCESCFLLLAALCQGSAWLLSNSGLITCYLAVQFRGFDADGDGNIDYDEFTQGLLSLGAQISMGQVRRETMIFC